MNYTNITARVSRLPVAPMPEQETIFSIETDKRGTHLRLRKTSTIARRSRRLGAAACAVLLAASQAFAVLSVYVPDAWTRNNTSTAAYFGWDSLEGTGAILGPGGGRVLDDTTPDVGFSLGTGVADLSGRLFQGTGPGGYGTYGHRSGSGNYYSGFNPTDFMDDTITAATRGSAGGFTTVVLQVLGTDTNAISDLLFTIGGGTFTLQKSLYGVSGNGTGQYWYEWTAPGGNLPVTIDLNSNYSSVGVESISVDTFWTNGGSPVVNSIQTVPEPTVTGLLGGLGLLGLTLHRRRSHPLNA